MEINDDTRDFLKFLNKDEIGFNKRLNIHYHDSYIKCYKVRHCLEIENNFKQNKINNGGSYSYLFHGSAFDNWYSIITNGLKNYSNTKNMINGQAYGSGIYLSDDYSVSQVYSMRSILPNKEIILGVYEIIGNKEKYQKTQNIYVIPDESNLLLRFIIISKDAKNISKYISEYFSKDILYEEYVKEKIYKSKGAKRIYKEYLNFTQNLQDVFKLSLENDDYIHKWYVYFKHDEIGANIKLYIEFNNYPFEPPFIHIVYPRFTRGTAHITSEGAICMESLTPSGWSSLVSIENLLIQIKTLIIDGNGKIDYTNKTQYTYTNAKQSFFITAKNHGWI
jgi:ubiquitin-protein ligase